MTEEYERSCREEGREPGLVITPGPRVNYIFVHEDPDGSWERIGPHLLHEAHVYRSWQPQGTDSATSTSAATLDELRDDDLFMVLRPEKAVAWAQDTGVVLLYPLCGGIPPDIAWEIASLLRGRSASARVMTMRPVRSPRRCFVAEIST